jgi:hypothetical protein
MVLLIHSFTFHFLLLQPQDILIAESLTAAPFKVLKHDDSVVPLLVREILKEKSVTAISFSSIPGIVALEIHSYRIHAYCSFNYKIFYTLFVIK